MVLKDLDNNFENFLNQIKQNPKHLELVLYELNLWLSSENKHGNKIPQLIDILYTILGQSPNLAKEIFNTSVLAYNYNNILSYSLLINLVHIDTTLADEVFSLLRKYLEKNASEGMLVCLCRLLIKLSIKHIDLKDKIHDFAKFILTLDANGKYSEKEAKCILSM